MSQHSRSYATFTNYAISLAIIVGICLVLAFVVSTRSGEHIPAVDYGADTASLRETAEYPVTVPAEDLPEEWVPTSSTLEDEGPVQWSLGFATPKDSHAMLTQSDDQEAAVEERVRDADAVGTVAVGDREWDHYEDGDDWGALVLPREDKVLIVSGPADLDELAFLAEGLETDSAEDSDDTGDGAEEEEEEEEDAPEDGDPEDGDFEGPMDPDDF